MLCLWITIIELVSGFTLAKIMRYKSVEYNRKNRVRKAHRMINTSVHFLFLHNLDWEMKFTQNVEICLTLYL